MTCLAPKLPKIETLKKFGLKHMGNRSIYILEDLNQAEALPLGEAGYVFRSLPFYIPPKTPKVLIPSAARKFRKCSFYRSLLRGIDSLVSAKATVINLSLGLTSTNFEPEEPIHLATKIAYKNRISVLTAVGNHGPGLNTIQSIAHAPWVISVGATDERRVLLNRSSRGGSESNVKPTVVSSGVSRFNEQAKSMGIPTFKPNTSFACAHISAVVSFTKMILETIRTLIRNFQKGIIRDQISPIYLQMIGFCDTGSLKGMAPEIPIAEIKEIVEEGGTGFSIPHSTHGLKWVNEFCSYAIENPNNRRYDPDVDMVKRFVSASSMRLPNYAEFEVGSGYLDLDVAIEWWSKLPLRTFLFHIFPSESESIRRFFNTQEPLFLFDREQLEVIAAASISIRNMVKVR